MLAFSFYSYIHDCRSSMNISFINAKMGVVKVVVHLFPTKNTPCYSVKMTPLLQANRPKSSTCGITWNVSRRVINQVSKPATNHGVWLCYIQRTSCNWRSYILLLVTCMSGFIIFFNVNDWAKVNIYLQPDSQTFTLPKIFNKAYKLANQTYNSN